MSADRAHLTMKLRTFELTRMRAAGDKAASLMRTLANEDRLALLCQLAQGELCVSELAEKTFVVQPTLSQQLSVLREQGVVATRCEGKRIFYSISDPKAFAVLRTLYDLYGAK